MNGNVKWYNGKKGYGFIKGEDGSEYFIHYSQLENGTFLKDEDAVTFDPVDTDKGKQAQNVKKVEGSSAPAEDMAEEAPVEEAEEAPAEEVEEAPAEEVEEAPAEDEAEEEKKEE